MPMGIRVTNEDSWSDRIDKMERLFSTYKPIYVLPGPGLVPEVRYLLIHDQPWTPEAVRTLLEEMEPRAEAEETWAEVEDSRLSSGYDAWIETWIDSLPF